MREGADEALWDPYEFSSSMFQDLPGACSITDLHDALSLSEVGDRRLFLISTHAKKGQAELSSGIQHARDLIIQMVCDGR